MQRVAALAGRPLRIALLTSSRSWRGSSMVFAALARGLADRGHTTTALAAYEPVATQFTTQGVSVRTLPVAHTGLTAARALRGTLRELCADIILVDMARDIRHAAAASLGRSLAVVYCISTPEPPRDLFTRIPFGWCGAAAPEAALRAQARQLGVNATFLGQVEPPTLVGAYNAATCVVHTRPDETFGLALAEAMACGRPVLAPASGGPVEVVGDAGVLAASEDPRGFAT